MQTIKIQLPQAGTPGGSLSDTSTSRRTMTKDASPTSTTGVCIIQRVVLIAGTQTLTACTRLLNVPGVAKDTFDLYPEVYVGRLPVTNKREVSNMVQEDHHL